MLWVLCCNYLIVSQRRHLSLAFLMSQSLMLPSPCPPHFSSSHLAPSSVSPLLQSLHIIYLINLDLEGLGGRCRAPMVRRGWRSQRAIYPACTWAGGGRGRRGDGLLGRAVGRRDRRGIQGESRDQTPALET